MKLDEKKPIRFLPLRRSRGFCLSGSESLSESLRNDPMPFLFRIFHQDLSDDQRLSCLYVLLREWKSLPGDREFLERLVGAALRLVAVTSALRLFVALKKNRIGGKSLSRIVLRYLFDARNLSKLRGRTGLFRAALEHALGRNTARGMVKRIASDDSQAAEQLFRCAAKPARAKRLLLEAYGHFPRRTAGPGAKEDTTRLTRLRKHVFPTAESPKTVTATTRGDTAATLVHIYRGGKSESLLKAAEDFADRAAEKLPKCDARVAMVLDASASTRSSGSREYSGISQSVALAMVLGRCCRLEVFQVGGTGNPPEPEGSTDLAAALLDAVESAPDAILIVSDGYENRGDDLQFTLGSLPEKERKIPMVFARSNFSANDSVEGRSPAAGLPERNFWHEDDFEEIACFLFSSIRSDAAYDMVKNRLEALIEKIESFDSKNEIERRTP